MMDELIYDLDDILSTLVHDFLRDPTGRVAWDKVKAEPLKRLYIDWRELGFVRREKLLDRTLNTLCKAFLHLCACNTLMGHSESDPTYIFEEAGIELNDRGDFSDENLQDMFIDYFSNPELGSGAGAWCVSYSGERQIWPLIDKIGRGTKEDDFVLMDRILQVTHRRNDLSFHFVEGGTDTLDEIFNM